MARKPRHLSPDEAELWNKVARDTNRLEKSSARPTKTQIATTKPPKAKSPIAPFRIGQRDSSIKSATATGPAAPTPPAMDPKAYKKLQRGKLKPQARIDLHGMTLVEAQPALTRFILNARADGLRLVLVITGKGRDRGSDAGPIPQRKGVLRDQVPRWLRSEPCRSAVLDVVQAHASHGGGGAIYVYLRRNR